MIRLQTEHPLHLSPILAVWVSQIVSLSTSTSCWIWAVRHNPSSSDPAAQNEHTSLFHKCFHMHMEYKNLEKWDEVPYENKTVWEFRPSKVTKQLKNMPNRKFNSKDMYQPTRLIAAESASCRSYWLLYFFYSHNLTKCLFPICSNPL